MNGDLMDVIIEKCKENEAYAAAFDYLLKAAQTSSIVGMTREETITIVAVGWEVGNDPSLSEMLKTLTEISKMGLEIKDK